jgi:hypothetical protein
MQLNRWSSVNQWSGASVNMLNRWLPVNQWGARQRFVSSALLAIDADFIASGIVTEGSDGSESYVSPALLTIDADFIGVGEAHQRERYRSGGLVVVTAGFIAGAKIHHTIKKLRHSGHKVWNEQARKDQIEYVRQHPDSFTALLYMPLAQAEPDPVDTWLEQPLFGRVDKNQQAGGYDDPVVCWVFERPREGSPFVVDEDGGDLINEHEDYLTICSEMDLPVGAALEFEDELAEQDEAGNPKTRRSWWYVHHTTSLGTTKAGSVYYLIPLRDFTGLNA